MQVDFSTTLGRYDIIIFNLKKVVLVVGAVDLWTTSIFLIKIPFVIRGKQGCKRVDNPLFLRWTSSWILCGQVDKMYTKFSLKI